MGIRNYRPTLQVTTRGVKWADWFEIRNIKMSWIEIGLGLDQPKFTFDSNGLDSNGLKNRLGIDPPNLTRLISIT